MPYFMHAHYQRRVRIESGAENNIHPSKVRIYDVETGEEIINVYKATITLSAEDINRVVLDYYEYDTQGKVCIDEHGAPICGHVTLLSPVISVTAWEETLK